MNHRGRILAVDDEETTLEIYRDMLEPLGWLIETAKSYVEAVERLDEGGWSVVLLDQRLRVLSMIERLPKPSIALLYGYCLGGGLELPLACHFRLAASEGAKIGLPELDLGTVPAWGGTARLTRTVGRDSTPATVDSSKVSMSLLSCSCRRVASGQVSF